MRAGLAWRGSSGPSRRGALSGAAAKDGGAAVRASSMASAQLVRASSTKIKSVSLRRRPPRGAERGRAPPDGDRSDRRPPPRWPGRALDGRCAATCDAGGDATEAGDAVGGDAQAKSSPGAAHAMGLSVFGAKFRVGSFGMCRTGASVVATAWGRRRAASVSGADLRRAASRARRAARGSPMASRRAGLRSRADETVGAAARSRARGRRSAGGGLAEEGARRMVPSPGRNGRLPRSP